MVSAELLAQSIPASTDPVAGPSGVAIHMSASRKFPAERAWSRAFYPHLTDPGIMALCRHSGTDRTLGEPIVKRYRFREAMMNHSPSGAGWSHRKRPHCDARQ